MFIRLIQLIIIADIATACGQSSPPPSPDASTLGWQPLVSKAWELAPGEERKGDLQLSTVDHDMYVGGIRPIAPVGTHHTIAGRGQDVAAGINIIYASGVGTGELMFPPGKGLKLSADTVVGVKLHLFNSTEAPLTGTSGIEVFEVPAEQVTDEVDLFLPGPSDFMLAPHQSTTASGTCTVKTAQTLFALFPHMHVLGTHFKTSVTVGGVERVIHDADYHFEEQSFYSIEPVTLSPGDKITTECTWFNTSDEMVEYGESTKTEMCYSILYRYGTNDDEFCEDGAL